MPWDSVTGQYEANNIHLLTGLLGHTLFGVCPSQRLLVWARKIRITHHNCTLYTVHSLYMYLLDEEGKTCLSPYVPSQILRLCLGFFIETHFYTCDMSVGCNTKHQKTFERETSFSEPLRWSILSDSGLVFHCCSVWGSTLYYSSVDVATNTHTLSWILTSPSLFRHHYHLSNTVKEL